LSRRTRLTVQIVGSGDAFGTGGRFQACISLRWQRAHVLLDCGASSLIALKRVGLDPGSVDAVVVTHLHGDHFGGIPFLVLDQQFSRRERPLTIAGPVGVRQRLLDAMETLFPGSASVERRFDLAVVELVARTPTRIGGAALSVLEMVHPSGAAALGLRIRCGDRLVAYSGDTEWTDRLIELAAGADLFICEAYTFERTINYHMSYAALQRRRAELTCRRLLLTHMGPDLLAHQMEVDAEIASDGFQIDL
jgi:ribonuclease BN (tRNA processing enzyme)